MNYRTVSWYQEFHCIGGVCEDSCCENWEIDLDEASLKNYMKQGGAFGKRLKDSTRVKDKQFILKGTRCPFLNDDNLCDIFIEMGEEHLCETCTNFPRHIEEFDDLKEVSLTMSCPEASRIMLAKKDKMEFVCKEGTDEEYGLKHLKPVKSLAFWKKGHVNKLDKELFDVLFEARALMFQMLQNRTDSIRMRAAKVVLFGEEIQKAIDQNQYGEIRVLTKKYEALNSGDFEKILEPYYNRAEEKQDFMQQVLNMYEGLETIKQEWTDILKNGIYFLQKDSSEYEKDFSDFWNYYADKEYEFEHILVYYIFNYYLGAAYDYDAMTKLKFAIISYLVVLELDVAHFNKQNRSFEYKDQVLVAHAYSKEVEHSYNNFESLQLVLSAHPVLDVDHILLGLLS